MKKLLRVFFVIMVLLIAGCGKEDRKYINKAKIVIVKNNENLENIMMRTMNLGEFIIENPDNPTAVYAGDMPKFIELIFSLTYGVGKKEKEELEKFKLEIPESKKEEYKWEITKKLKEENCKFLKVTRGDVVGVAKILEKDGKLFAYSEDIQVYKLAIDPILEIPNENLSNADKIIKTVKDIKTKHKI